MVMICVQSDWKYRRNNFRDVIATMLVYRQQKPISYWFRLLKFINMAKTTLSFESLGTGSIISRPGCTQKGDQTDQILENANPLNQSKPATSIQETAENWSK